MGLSGSKVFRILVPREEVLPLAGGLSGSKVFRILIKIMRFNVSPHFGFLPLPTVTPFLPPPPGCTWWSSCAVGRGDADVRWVGVTKSVAVDVCWGGGGRGAGCTC